LNNKPNSKTAQRLRKAFFVLLSISLVVAFLALLNFKLYGAYTNFLIISSFTLIAVAYYLHSFYRHIDGDIQKLAKLIAFPVFFLFAVSVYPFLLKLLWLSFGFFGKENTAHTRINDKYTVDFYNQSDSSYAYTNIRLWERKLGAFEKMKFEKVVFDKMAKDHQRKVKNVEIAEFVEGEKLKIRIKDNNDSVSEYEMNLRKRNVWFLR